MITNKHMNKIIVVMVSLALILCLCLGLYSKNSSSELATQITMEYEKSIFDTQSIIDIEILMEDEKWEEMLASATEEEYFPCDVIINGTRIHNVGIRPKGNTSLSAIVSDPDSDRYSFKIEFDQYVEGQTYQGLDKLILNNSYADATNMKEAIVYDMYQYLDADASLYNYASISLNEEYLGVYFALEAVEDSFLLRNYGVSAGELYKPDSMDMAGGNQGGGNRGEGFTGTMPERMENFGGQMPEGMENFGGQMPEGMENFGGQIPEGMENFGGQIPEGMENFGGQMQGGKGNFTTQGGFGMGGGSDLNYTDDNLDSYATIWDGAVTKTSEVDHAEVVTALKNIHEGSNLSEYLDIDNVLKYMAVHTFAVNMDSLTGSMSHNYYLYESDGKLNILPWDYNLSFGGMSQGMGMNTRRGDNSQETDSEYFSTATTLINFPIDTPFQSTEFFDALLNNHEYLQIYHSYLQQLVDEYVYGGRLEETYTRIRGQIDELVKEDPTAFYTYEEYEVGSATLYETLLLRADSIKGQLEGTIPSTSSGQDQDSTALIDGSHIDVSLMGEFNMGGGRDTFSNMDTQNGTTTTNPFGGNRENSDASGGASMRQRPTTVSDKVTSNNRNVGTNFMEVGLTYGILIIILIIGFVVVKKTKTK